MKNRTNKVLAVALAITLLALAVVAGTLAYLTSETAAIKNVFVKGAGIEIELFENEIASADFTVANGKFTYSPNGYAKKEIVVQNTVNATEAVNGVSAEDCYVFIMITVGADFSKYAEYAVDDDNWTRVESVNKSNAADPEADELVAAENVYVYAYTAGGDMATLKGETSTPELLKDYGTAGTQIHYKNLPTSAIEAWDEENEDVSLTFTAFAVQAYGLSNTMVDADTIWEEFWN